jgi:hypothetical protein
MKDKDLEIIRSAIRYNSNTGHFFKGGANTPAALSWKNKNATINVKKSGMHSYFLAWRIAVFLAYGWYPEHTDAVEYLDGNPCNLSISNIKVIKAGEDEMTMIDFCDENDLRYPSVSALMRGEPFIRRVENGYSRAYFNKKLLEANCAKLLAKKLRDEEIREKPRTRPMGRRRNEHFMEFLRTHTIVPKGWEMTLC